MCVLAKENWFGMFFGDSAVFLNFVKEDNECVFNEYFY